MDVCYCVMKKLELSSEYFWKILQNVAYMAVAKYTIFEISTLSS